MSRKESGSLTVSQSRSVVSTPTVAIFVMDGCRYVVASPTDKPLDPLPDCAHVAHENGGHVCVPNAQAVEDALRMIDSCDSKGTCSICCGRCIQDNKHYAFCTHEAVIRKDVFEVVSAILSFTCPSCFSVSEVARKMMEVGNFRTSHRPKRAEIVLGRAATSRCTDCTGLITRIQITPPPLKRCVEWAKGATNHVQITLSSPVGSSRYIGEPSLTVAEVVRRVEGCFAKETTRDFIDKVFDKGLSADKLLKRTTRIHCDPHRSWGTRALLFSIGEAHIGFGAKQDIAADNFKRILACQTAIKPLPHGSGPLVNMRRESVGNQNAAIHLELQIASVLAELHSAFVAERRTKKGVSGGAFSCTSRLSISGSLTRLTAVSGGPQEDSRFIHISQFVAMAISKSISVRDEEGRITGEARTCVANGKYRYIGANFGVAENGAVVDIPSEGFPSLNDADEFIQKMKLRTLYRHLVNGDTIAVWRSPFVKMDALMFAEVRVVEGMSRAAEYSGPAIAVMDLDYDGDTVWLAVVGSLVQRVIASNAAPESKPASMKVIQQALLGYFKGVREQTQYPWKRAVEILAPLGREKLEKFRTFAESIEPITAKDIIRFIAPSAKRQNGTMEEDPKRAMKVIRRAPQEIVIGPSVSGRVADNVNTAATKAKMSDAVKAPPNGALLKKAIEQGTLSNPISEYGSNTFVMNVYLARAVAEAELRHAKRLTYDRPPFSFALRVEKPFLLWYGEHRIEVAGNGVWEVAFPILKNKVEGETAVRITNGGETVYISWPHALYCNLDAAARNEKITMDDILKVEIYQGIKCHYAENRRDGNGVIEALAMSPAESLPLQHGKIEYVRFVESAFADREALFSSEEEWETIDTRCIIEGCGGEQKKRVVQYRSSDEGLRTEIRCCKCRNTVSNG